MREALKIYSMIMVSINIILFFIRIFFTREETATTWVGFIANQFFFLILLGVLVLPLFIIMGKILMVISLGLLIISGIFTPQIVSKGDVILTLLLTSPLVIYFFKYL